jgi:transcriptional regulator with XRE-family HTH domain
VLDATKFFGALGRRIRSIRERRRYTQEDMISFGFSARHWQQIEKGRPTTMKTLLRVTIALDVPLSKLVRGLPRPPISHAYIKSAPANLLVVIEL